MRLVAFAASTSKNSINKKFVEYAAEHFQEFDIEILDLNNYPLPVYSIDLQKDGIPDKAIDFDAKLQEADLLVISLAEHNGSYTAAFKNLFDWVSRYHRNMFEGKKLILLSTSTGSRGGKSVMEAALNRFPKHKAEIIGNFSLPDFDDNFQDNTGITNPELNIEFEAFIGQVKETLNLNH